MSYLGEQPDTLFIGQAVACKGTAMTNTFNDVSKDKLIEMKHKKDNIFLLPDGVNIEDFNTLSEKTPYITNLRPAGKYVMSDVDKAGGVPVILKELLNAGLLHGDVLTITGKTMSENFI